VQYGGKAKHLATVLSNITIPVGDELVPLVLMTYEVDLPRGATIVLGVDEPEETYEWSAPPLAAERLQRKYPQEFCDMVAALSAQ
jgi:hypothetical protein